MGPLPYPFSDGESAAPTADASLAEGQKSHELGNAKPRPLISYPGCYLAARDYRK